MAFIPVPNTVQGRVEFLEAGGLTAQNVFYFATASVPTMDDLEEIGGLFQDWALEDYAPMMTENWRITGINLRAMNEEEGISLNYTDGFPVVGTAGVDSNPAQVSYTVTWSTGLVGRSARGRTYGVGLELAGLAGINRLNDVTRDAFQINWSALRTLMETNGHALQVVSFQEGGVPRATGRPLPVLSNNVRFPIATQRRRLA